VKKIKLIFQASIHHLKICTNIFEFYYLNLHMAHPEELNPNHLKKLLVEQSSFADQKRDLINLYQDFYLTQIQ